MWRYAVVGNIKKQRIDENGVLRFGTSAYKGNTKVYIYGRLWDERLPDKNKNEIAVLGFCRGRRYYFDSVPIDLIENVRLTRVYKPKVLKLMSNYEYADGWWCNTEEDREDAMAFLKKWKEKYGTE